MTVAITCNCGNTFTASVALARRLIACPVCNDLLSVEAGEVVGTVARSTKGGVLPDGELQIRLEPADEVAMVPAEAISDPRLEDDGPDTYQMSQLQPWQTRGAMLPSHRFWAALGVIGLGEPASCLAYGPFNEWALAGCGLGVQLLKMKSGAKGNFFRKHEAPVTALAISPDGRSALTADAGGDLFWWELASGAVTQRVRAHIGPATALAVAPEGGLAISGGADGAVRLWDLSCGCHNVPIAMPGERGEIAAVQFSSDGKTFLAADADGRIDVWRTETGNVALGVTAKEPVVCVRSFEDYITAVVRPATSEIGVHPRVLRWDGLTGKPMQCFGKAMEPRLIPELATLDRDGRRLMVAGRLPALPFQHVPSALAGTLAEVRDGFRDFFRIRQDGQTATFLEAWSLGSGACLHGYAPVPGQIHGIALAPDNTRILAAASTGHLHVFAMPEA